MKASRKNPPGYPGIALRTIALTCFLTFISATFGRALILLGKFRQIKLGLIPVIFIAFVEISHAETFPATITYYWSTSGDEQQFLTIDQACLANVAAGNILWPGANNVYKYWVEDDFVGDVINSAWCYGTSGQDPSNHHLGSVGRSYTATCPSNSKLTWSAWNSNDTAAAGTCEASDCPVTKLSNPPFSDACSTSLEQGKGKDVNNACSSKLLPEMQKQAQCLADKIHALGQPYTGPSATVRTVAYQQHLLDVWNKSIEIENKDLSDEEELACAAIIENVDNEMKRHGIKSDPSNKGNAAPHVLGKAIDIPMDVVDALKARVSNTTFVTFTGCIFCIPIAITTIGDVQDYVNSATVNPPACNLKWGGRFKRIDDVHFQLP